MAEHGSLLRSTTQKQSKTASFPRLLTAFSFKSFTENDAVASPTSILDTKPFSIFKNPFWSENSKTQEPETRHKIDPKGIGLAIIDTILDDESSELSTRKVLFGSQLRIQIPPPSPSDSPEGFGSKSRNSHLGSPEKEKPRSGFLDSDPDSPRSFTGCFSASDMELSEDYTCVISHGPNPRRIHIFDNHIVEYDYGAVRSSNSILENGSGYPSESFLRYCHACKKNLGHGRDIFIYRGEKAFCSDECRHQEIMLEDMYKLDCDNTKRTCS